MIEGKGIIVGVGIIAIAIVVVIVVVITAVTIDIFCVVMNNVSIEIANNTMIHNDDMVAGSVAGGTSIMLSLIHI